MAVYFFDSQQNLLKLVPDNQALAVRQTQELTDELLKDTLGVTIQNDETLLDAEYMAVKSYGEVGQVFDMYRVTNIQTGDEQTSYTGIQVAYYELHGYVVEDVRPENKPVSEVATRLLEDTDWRVGYVDEGLPTVTGNFYYTSVKNAFATLQELANCEVIFKVEISGRHITDKWVEIYDQIGDRTMQRFTYGSTALTVEREIGKNEIYTALLGRGKGEEVFDESTGESTGGYGRKINFAEVEWSVANGDPLDKPYGQKYLELPEATQQFGIRRIDGTMAPRIGLIEFSQTTDPEVLIQETHQALIDMARPKVQFKSTVLRMGDTKIGDTITIHRYDLNLHYMVRVFKIVRDRLDDSRTEVHLGDAISQASTRKQARQETALRNLEATQEEVVLQVNHVGRTADGKNRINFGNQTPDRMRTGDMWYRDHPSLTGHTQLLLWNGDTWEVVLDTSQSVTKEELEEAKSLAQDAVDKAEGTVDQINGSLEGTGFTNLKDLIASKIGEDRFNTLFYQEAQGIGLVYMVDGQLESIIAIQEGMPLIKGEHIVLSGDTVVDGTFTVTEDMIADNAVIDRLKATGIDANQIRVVNLDFESMSGGDMELTRGFRITNNGEVVLSVDGTTGKVVFNAPDVATKEDLEQIELTPGQSAYEVAVENGFQGTEAQWLASLEGPKGDPGVSVDRIQVEYAVSSSNTTTPTGGWVTDIPTRNEGQYLWVRDRVFYSDGTQEVVGERVVTGDRGTDGEDGTDGVSITGVTAQYAVNASTSTAPTSGWQSASPTRRKGEHIWRRDRITYSDGTSDLTTPVMVTGDAGDDGAPGEDGVSITNVFTEYAVTSSATSAPSSGWTQTMPTRNRDQYLWVREKFLYSDESMTITGARVVTGDSGSDGSDGTSITKVEGQYAVNTSPTNPPTTGWSTAYPTRSNGQYIWWRDKIYYSDGTNDLTNPVMVTGDKGDKGSDGISVTSVDVQYYLSTSATSLSGGSWSTSPPTWVNGRYMWTKTVTTYSNGATTESSPVNVTGAKGSTGSPGTPGTDGRSVSSLEEQYYLSDSKTETTGGTWVTTQPDWETGKYMWTRIKITYENPSGTDYTTPIVDASWEAVDQLANTKADKDTVDDLSSDLNNFETIVATKEELGEVVSSLNTYMALVEDNQIGVQEASEAVSDLLSRVPILENNLGQFVEQWSFLDTFIRMGEEGFYIGSETGSTGIRITDDRIDFLDGSGEPVAYITNQVMRINRGIFVQSATIGEHKFEIMSAGHLVIQWVK